MTISAAHPESTENRRQASSVSAEVFGDAGFSTCLSLSMGELESFRALMREEWIRRIGEVFPRHAEQFRSISPAQYHEFSHMLPHEKLWSFQHRQFSLAAVERITRFEIFEILSRAFPKFEFTGRNPPHEDLGRTRMVWRIVRPGIDLDVGPCHADYWFDAVQSRPTNYPIDYVPVKLWIPLWNDTGKTGLSVISGSHKQAWPYGEEIRDGVVKPTFMRDCSLEREHLLDVEEGSLVIFSDRLLHRGTNSEDARYTRVSVEIVLLVPKSVIREHYADAQGLEIWSPSI
jgi:hypothetical protein